MGWILELMSRVLEWIVQLQVLHRGDDQMKLPKKIMMNYVWSGETRMVAFIFPRDLTFSDNIF